MKLKTQAATTIYEASLCAGTFKRKDYYPKNTRRGFDAIVETTEISVYSNCKIIWLDKEALLIIRRGRQTTREWLDGSEGESSALANMEGDDLVQCAVWGHAIRLAVKAAEDWKDQISAIMPKDDERTDEQVEADYREKERVLAEIELAQG